jgi:hypothetical protein
MVQSPANEEDEYDFKDTLQEEEEEEELDTDSDTSDDAKKNDDPEDEGKGFLRKAGVGLLFGLAAAGMMKLLTMVGKRMLGRSSTPDDDLGAAVSDVVDVDDVVTNTAHVVNESTRNGFVAANESTRNGFAAANESTRNGFGAANFNSCAAPLPPPGVETAA